MATMTIRNLDDRLKARLRIRAAEHQRSMEDEARNILRAALATRNENSESLVKAVRARLASINGHELELPARDPIRTPPDFSA